MLLKKYRDFFNKLLSLYQQGITAAKVGIFSKGVQILVSFVLRIQTRSIRLVSFHSTYGFLYPLFYAFKQGCASSLRRHYPLLRKGYKDNGFARSMRTFYPLLVEGYQAQKYVNKKYKVGIFSQHLQILVSFVLRIQTRSIRLCGARMDSCILCFTHSNKKYKVVRSTYGFLYPLFYAVKLRLREKYANLLSLAQLG